MISNQVLHDLAEAKLIIMHVDAFRPKGWSIDEQERFWEALERFPDGPWTSIAGHIGTKDTRQAMTFSQKVRQKLDRWRHKRSRAAKSARAVTQDAMYASSSPRSPSGAAFSTARRSSMPLEDAATPIPFIVSTSSSAPAYAQPLTPVEADFVLEVCLDWGSGMVATEQSSVTSWVC